MFKRILAFAVVAAGLAAVLPARAQEADAAKILRVERREEAVASRNPMYRRMPKFSNPSQNLAREVYEVTWAPPAAGLSAGATLLFDYRQEYVDGARTLKIQYPFFVRNERTATFIVSEKAVLDGGRVTAWRVRLAMGRQLLAQRASGAWK